jgi:CRP-like cAMP-binding protein
MPGENIYKSGEQVNEMYFLNEGVIEIIKPEENESSLLTNGDHFG